MKRQVPATLIAALVLVVIAAVGYFLLIRPKQSEAGRLATDAANLQAQVDTARAAAHKPSEPAPADESTIKFADVFRLTRAMPEKEDMAGIMIELDSVAGAAGVDFVAITPLGPEVRTGYTALPINVTFEGNFFDLTDFLFRLRNLVRVRDGRLESDGRLFDVEAFDLQEGTDGFPQVTAALKVTAYIYSTTPPPTASATGTPPATTATTTTTTTTPAASQALGGGTG